MPCINTYTFDDPLIFDDNATIAERVALPYIVNCENDIKTCDQLWQNILCGSDKMYYQPIVEGDNLYIQTRFYDAKNLPNAGCTPPLKPGYSIGAFTIIDPPPPTVLFGNAARLAGKDVLLNFNFNPFNPCSFVGQVEALTTGAYPDWQSWRAGILNFCLVYNWAGNPTKTAIYDDTNTLIGIQLEWLNSDFFARFGYNPCDNVELVMCWHKWLWDNPLGFRVEEVNTSLPHPDVSIIPFRCCPEKPPCFGLAKSPDGCTIPAGFGRATFQINDTGYIYGAAAQALANAGDAGLVIQPSFDPCPNSDAVVNPAWLLSNATDFANYLDNIKNYFEATYLGGLSTITVTPSGEFTILFDKDWHSVNQSWDVCTTGLSFCEIRYPTTTSCTKGTYLEVALVLDNFPISLSVTQVSIFASDCGFGLVLDSIRHDSVANFLTDLLTEFNIDALGTSYAVLFAPEFGDGSYNGIKLFFDLTAYPAICNCKNWAILSISEPTLTSKIYRKNVCCITPCAINEAGFVSFDFFIDEMGLSESTATNVQLQYRCGGVGGFVDWGSVITFPDFTNGTAGLINRILNKMNDKTQQIALSLPLGIYGTRYGNKVRLKIPITELPCGCEEIEMRLEIEQVV